MNMCCPFREWFSHPHSKAWPIQSPEAPGVLEPPALRSYSSTREGFGRASLAYICHCVGQCKLPPWPAHQGMVHCPSKNADGALITLLPIPQSYRGVFFLHGGGGSMSIGL